jgi:PAS domain S-box-containing protein
VPLLIWFLLTAAGVSGALWQQQSSRQSVVQRFQLRVGLIGDFVTSYTADQIARERVQADASLADRSVTARDFARAVAGFGYPAAVLLDAHGRALQVIPHDPMLVGVNLTGRYAHLRTAVWQGRPAVSPVVLSAAQGVPVVAFAVPFATPAGRRVFSGAVDIKRSALTSYLTNALPLAGAQVQLVDHSGNIVAANRTLAGTIPTLSAVGAPLAAALTRHSSGRYRAAGRWWQYRSTPIPGTPWRLSAAVDEQVLYASLAGNETAGHAALGGAAVVGLLVVIVAARARRSRLDLQLSEYRFRRVFDGSRIAMVLTDTYGRFVRLNTAACEMFGRSQQELTGTLFAEVTHPDDGHAAAVLARDCLAGRIDGFDLDKRYLHDSGRIIDASITSTLLRDRSGRAQYFATQVVDMTERRALERVRDDHERELGQRAEQLQEANAHLADFMAMLTHDVRQPLSNIVGLTELLLEEWPESGDDDKYRDVQRVNAAGHRAGDLVTDILTLAQLDAGALRARPVRIDISHAVREAVAAHQKSDPGPVTVVAPDQTDGLADPTHLPLILGNLLANAAKYGRPPVTVTVTNRRDQIIIQVSDEGEGVPEAFVPQLFERFTRAETGVATTANGTGLGLYLVRQLATAGGLDIGYTPNQPSGSAFTVTVPCTPPKIGNLGRLRTDPISRP